MEIQIWLLVIIIISAIAVGFLLGLLILNYLLKKQAQKMQKDLETADKEQLKSMLSVFGKTPSEEQLNRIVESAKQKKEQKPKKKK
jgi:uncharacterized protein YneF (UPF0154 family)